MFINFMNCLELTMNLPSVINVCAQQNCIGIYPIALETSQKWITTDNSFTCHRVKSAQATIPETSH